MPELKDLLDPLIDELGDAPDTVYIASSRWPAVVETAKQAPRTIARYDTLDGSDGQRSHPSTGTIAPRNSS